MNCYITLPELKDALSITDTANDVRLLGHIADVSRDIDTHCHRHFYVKNDTRIFGVRGWDFAYLDDFLSLSSLAADSELDNTFDGETWELNTDYIIGPDNEWPKMKVIPLAGGRFTLPTKPTLRYLKATGLFGFGNGESGAPWEMTGATVTVASLSATTATVSDIALFQAGQTLLIGDEQVFVSRVTTGQSPSITIERGVNGTTAATHAAATASKALYPGRLTRGCLLLCVSAWYSRTAPGVTSERFADGSGYTKSQDYEDIMSKIFNRYSRESL